MKRSRSVAIALVILVGSLFASNTVAGAEGTKHKVDADPKNTITKGVQPYSIEPPQYRQLSVPMFSQNDSRWSGDIMRTLGDTIGAAGCALTSTTMVFNYYGDTHTPKTENTCLGTHAELIDWDYAHLNCSSGKAGAPTKDYNISSGDAVNLWNNGLSLWIPPIVEAVKLTNPNDTHWMVVVKVAGDPGLVQSYWVNNPWAGTVDNLYDYLNRPGLERKLNSYVTFPQLP